MEKELEKILLKNEKLEKVFKNIIEETEIFFPQNSWPFKETD